MTDRDTKKARLAGRPAILASVRHERVTAKDPFEDDGLDELLRDALDETAEPRLLLVDFLLNGTRVRREV